MILKSDQRKKFPHLYYQMTGAQFSQFNINSTIKKGLIQIEFTITSPYPDQIPVPRSHVPYLEAVLVRESRSDRSRRVVTFRAATRFPPSCCSGSLRKPLEGRFRQLFLDIRWGNFVVADWAQCPCPAGRPWFGLLDHAEAKKSGRTGLKVI